MFSNQTYLITNATNQSGIDIAISAISKGANILFNYPSSVSNTELQTKLKTPIEQNRLTLIPGDIKHESDVEKLFNKINGRKISGIIHCLPNVKKQKKSLLDINLEDWNQSLQQTLHPIFYLARQVIEDFVTERVPGRFIIFQMDESETKEKDTRQATLETALLAFCRSVAKEYGRRNVSCNAVYANKKNNSNDDAALTELILFLLTKQSEYITGEVIDLR